MKKLGDCTAITLYNLDDCTDIRGFFAFIENWMITHGYQPLRASIALKGLVSKKTKTFKYVKKTFLEAEPSSIRRFWFAGYDSTPDYDCLDGMVSAELEIDKTGLFCLYFHESINLNHEINIRQLTQEISKYIHFNYGIVYHREWSKGPGLYASGIITGLDDSIPQEAAEEDHIGEWFRQYFLDSGNFKKSQYRDIYPINYLSEAHLKEPVFNTTMEDWIKSTPTHGELTKITYTIWEWSIPEEHISLVRETLRPTGLIVCI